MTRSRSRPMPNRDFDILPDALVIAAIAATAPFNYLLFHTLAELFSIIIAYSIFIVAWNTRKFAQNTYFLWVGIAYLFVGIFDLFHTLSYKGMGIFAQDTANVATQLWIAARYVESLSLLAATIFYRHPVKPRWLWLGYVGLSVFLLGEIFHLRNFPTCFIEGVGLTPFKKISELMISLILLLAIARLEGIRHRFDIKIFRLLVFSLILTIIAEFAFIFYIDVYGTSNFIGHLFKIVSFYLIYKAIIALGLTQPYGLLFRQEKQYQSELKQKNQQLRHEIGERQRSEHQKETLNLISKLFLSSQSLSQTYAELSQLLADRFQFPIVAIEWFDPLRLEMTIVGAVGLPTSPGEVMRIPVDRSISGTVATTGEAAVEGNASRRPEYQFPALKALEVETFLCVPIPTHDRILGTLALADRRRHSQDLFSLRETLQAIANALGQEIERKQAETEIRLAYKQLSEMKYALDRAAIVAIADAEGTLTYVNDKFCEISGYGREELLGKTHRLLHSDCHPPPFFRELWATISKGEIWQGEIQNRAKDGRLYWVDTTIVPFLDADGKPWQYLAIRWDITTGKQVKDTLAQFNYELEVRVEQRTRELRESNRKLRGEIALRQQVESDLRELNTALQNSVEGIVRLDRDGCYVSMNQAYIDCLCIRNPGDLIGRKWGQTIYPEDWSGAAIAYQKMLETGKVARELRGVREDGSIFYQDVTLIKADDGRGNFDGSYCFVKDIDDRKRAEIALRDSEERFRSLVANIPGAIYRCLCDSDSTMQFISHAIENISGYAPVELIQNMAISYASLIEPDDRETVEMSVKRAIAERKPFIVEYRIRHRNGEIRWVYEKGQGMFDRHGNILYLDGAIFDISDRKQSEIRLRNAFQKERELNRLKSQFIDIASHEFRTPLTSIIGSAEFLENHGHKLSQQKCSKHLHNIQRAGDRLNDLVNDILAISRADCENIKIRRFPLNLTEFCQELVEEFKMGLGKDHSLNLAVHSDCSAPVQLDEKLLKPILSNLISNAIKYSPIHSPVNIDVDCQKDRIKFEVSDRGIGIVPEDYENVFESFRRGRNVGKIPGTGLGLNIVKKYVELHGGAIALTSQIGVGTTFTVILPHF